MESKSGEKSHSRQVIWLRHKTCQEKNLTWVCSLRNHQKQSQSTSSLYTRNNLRCEYYNSWNNNVSKGLCDVSMVNNNVLAIWKLCFLTTIIPGSRDQWISTFLFTLTPTSTYGKFWPPDPLVWPWWVPLMHMYISFPPHTHPRKKYNCLHLSGVVGHPTRWCSICATLNPPFN